MRPRIPHVYVHVELRMILLVMLLPLSALNIGRGLGAKICRHPRSKVPTSFFWWASKYGPIVHQDSGLGVHTKVPGFALWTRGRLDVQGRSYSYTLGPKVGSVYVPRALGLC